MHLFLFAFLWKGTKYEDESLTYKKCKGLKINSKILDIALFSFFFCRICNRNSTLKLNVWIKDENLKQKFPFQTDYLSQKCLFLHSHRGKVEPTSFKYKEKVKNCEDVMEGLRMWIFNMYGGSKETNKREKMKLQIQIEVKTLFKCIKYLLY